MASFKNILGLLATGGLAGVATHASADAVTQTYNYAAGDFNTVIIGDSATPQFAYGKISGTHKGYPKSYTYGLGASPHTDGFAYQLGPKLGWDSWIQGVPGTGYLNPGPRHQGTFVQQLGAIPSAFDPGVLLVQGGRNDGNYPPDRLDAAVVATVQAARQRFHHARVVMLGPIPPHIPVDRILNRDAGIVGDLVPWLDTYEH